MVVEVVVSPSTPPVGLVVGFAVGRTVAVGTVAQAWVGTELAEWGATGCLLRMIGEALTNTNKLYS